jgi:NAD(P)-dependent dehydrogenase (short-subunit alcohol dehydrogenase family)
MSVFVSLFVCMALLLLLIAIALPFGFKALSRGNPAGPPIPLLLPSQVRAHYQDKRVLCVGCTKGLGEAIAWALVEAGAKVTVIGRSQSSARIKSRTDFIPADLSSLKTAHKLGKELKPYQLVVFTQGILATGPRPQSGEGIELDTAVSYLSRFVMAHELLPNLDASQGKPRMFVMGSPGADVAGQFRDLVRAPGCSWLG